MLRSVPLSQSIGANYVLDIAFAPTISNLGTSGLQTTASHVCRCTVCFNLEKACPSRHVSVHCKIEADHYASGLIPVLRFNLESLFAEEGAESFL